MIKHTVCFFALCAVALAINATERVKGGSFASAGEFPYQASVWQHNVHICGGAIITRKHVVTAASCLIHMIRNTALAVNVQVLVGTIDLTRDGILYDVEKMTPHPEYQWYRNYIPYDNDIAILHLADVMEESRFVKQINFPGLTQLPENAPLVFTGWGSLGPGGRTVRYLQKTTFRYIKTSECQSYYPKQKINMWQLCTAPSKFVGTCASDVGSPLVYRGALVGISSAQHGCGSGVPDVFTKVSFYLKFLVSETSS